MTRRTALWILLIIIIVAVGLRSYHLTSRSLWFDEAFSWRLIQFPIVDLISRTANDVHPPLYYLVLKGWRFVFSSSLLSMRSFSVLFAALTIAAGYRLASYAVSSRPVGLIFATFIAVSGWQIQYAWEARMYTFGAALLLLSTWLLLRAIRNQQSTSSILEWLAYAIVTAAAAYVHYFAFFSILAQVIFIIGYILYRTRGRIGEIFAWRLFWYAAVAALTMALIYLPWIPTFLTQNAQVQTNYWIPAIGGWSIPDTFYRMFAPTAQIPRHTGFGWIALAALPIVATLAGWAYLVGANLRRAKYPQDAAWLIMLSGLVPFLLTIVVSSFSQSIYQDRFFVFAHLFILLALSLLIWRIRSVWLRGTVLTVTVLGLLFTSFQYWQELDIPNRPGAAAATAGIFQRLSPGDQIIVSSPFIYFAIDYYASEQYRGTIRPKLLTDSPELLHFAGQPIITDQDLADPNFFATAESVWVVDTTGFGASPLVPPDNFTSTYQESFAEVFPHQGEVSITYYEANL